MELLSITQAAQDFGVSRKTVCRDIQRGHLVQVGSATKGRGARSLRRRDLEALYAPRNRARQTNAKSAPALGSLYRYLAAEQREDPRIDPCFIALSYLIVARHPDSDVDFMAYCSSMLVERNYAFMLGIFQAIPAAGNAFPHPYAAELFRRRLQEVAAACRIGRANTLQPTTQVRVGSIALFKRVVHALAWQMHEMSAEIDVKIFFNALSRDAEIILEPKWWQDGCRDQSATFGPDFGFRCSMLTAKDLFGRDHKHWATKLAACLYPASEGMQRNAAIRLVPDAEKLRAFNTLLGASKHDFNEAVAWSQTDGDGLDAAWSQTDGDGLVSSLLEVINSGVPEELRFRPMEARRLVSRLSVLRAGGDERASFTINIDSDTGSRGGGKPLDATENDDQNEDAGDATVLQFRSHRSRAMCRILAEAFGVSRQSMRTWLKDGKGRQSEFEEWMHAYADKLDALLHTEESAR